MLVFDVIIFFFIIIEKKLHHIIPALGSLESIVYLLFLVKSPRRLN